MALGDDVKRILLGSGVALAVTFGGWVVSSTVDNSTRLTREEERNKSQSEQIEATKTAIREQTDDIKLEVGKIEDKIDKVIDVLLDRKPKPPVPNDQPAK